MAAKPTAIAIASERVMEAAPAEGDRDEVKRRSVML